MFSSFVLCALCVLRGESPTRPVAFRKDRRSRSTDGQGGGETGDGRRVLHCRWWFSGAYSARKGFSVIRGCVITKRADWIFQPALVAQRNCCRSLTRLCTVVVFLVPVHLSGIEWCGGYRRRDSNPQGRKPRGVSGFCVYQFRHAGTPNTTTNPGKPNGRRHNKPDNSAVPQGQGSYPYPNGCHQFDATMTAVMPNCLVGR